MTDFTEHARDARAEGRILDAVADELQMLWGDLSDARRYAANGAWSIRCDSLVYRIMRLTLSTGRPTPWDEVQVDLLLDGTYEAIHSAIGTPTPLSAEDRARAEEVRSRP